MEQKLLNKLLAVFDIFTGLFTVMQADHKYIHDGLGYSTLVESNIAGSATYLIGVHTPAVKYIHIRPAKVGSVESGTKCYLYSGRAYTDGTAVTPVNKNENSSNVSTVVFKKGVTSPVTGTIISLFTTGSGGGNRSKAGGSEGANEEVILKRDTDYVFQITNTTATATDVLVDLFYYEEDQG